MRYAIFSDVHANLRAWEQALADIRGQWADVLVCLGDVVGYGPKPEEVLRGIREVTGNFVMGNHDAAAAGAMDYSIFNDQARHSIDWTIQALSTESRAFLGAVPLAIDAEEILFVHAEVSEPGRFAYIDDQDSATANFTDSSHFVTFVGHTHHPNIFQQGAGGSVSEFPDQTHRLDPSNRYIVNVGSVGEPRNPDDLRGVYVIYDSETREVDFRRVSFDIPAYRSDLESTSLEVKPFFLQSYEYQAAETQDSAPSAASALAIEAPAGATPLISQQGGPVKLHIPNEPLSFKSFGDVDRASLDKERSFAGRLAAALALIGVFAIAWIIWNAGPFRKDTISTDLLAVIDTSTVLTSEGAGPVPRTESAAASESAMEPGPEPILITRPNPEPIPETEPEPSRKRKPKPKPKPTLEKSAKMATAAVSSPLLKPKPEPKSETAPGFDLGQMVAWWRMEPDSVGGELVDLAEKHSLPAEVPGSRIGGLAPPVIPGNGAENQSALGLGVWTEPNPKDVFELRADRSFTLEGWVLTDKPNAPIFLAGTRSGDANENQGWHIDIRPPTNEFPRGQMCFFYDNGPEIVQALSEDVAITDLQPHHFAAVWDHDASATAGEMRLLLDGEQVAAAEVPHAQIPESQANPFRIGSPKNPPRIGLDEMRFSHAALSPRRLLNITPDIVLLAESFENPDVEGYKQGSAPPGWIGSKSGFGAGKRGLVDEGDGTEFTTPHGQQAFVLAYANSGLTSGQSAVREVLTAGRTYRVDFNVGVKKGEEATFLVELVAFESAHDDKDRRETRSGRPGVVLSKATGTTTTNDLSRTGSIVFQPDVANPHLGKAIGVRLIKANGNAIYDNIRLVSRADEPVFRSANGTLSSIDSAPPTPLPAPEPAKSALSSALGPKNDPTIAWWRMEPDSVGDELVDATERSPLPVLAAGKQIGGIAPAVIPANGIGNTAALSIGVWAESKPAGDFALGANRSFTIEGWVVTARPRGPIFVAGTRSGDTNDKQGWHIDIRPKGQMCFFYDTGAENLQALGEDVAAADLKPHHFAAVWDHDAAEAAGEMRLYFDGEQVAATEVPHAQIPQTQANLFRIGAPTNPPKIGLDEVRFSHAALSPLEFLRAEPQTMTKIGKWSVAANWSGGEPPSGTQTAVIGPGVAAEVEDVPAEFAGDLVLGNASSLTIRKLEAFAVVPDPPSKLVLHQGAELIVMTGNGGGNNITFGQIELVGGTTIWGGRSTSGHHAKRVFSGEISGEGALVVDGVNNNEFVLEAANSFSGGFIAKSSQNQGFHVLAQVAGSLGKGNVEIAAVASLFLEAEDAIAPQAALTLTGVKDNRSPAKVILNANNSVAGLIFDGERQAAGTWGAADSGADHEHANFSGSGMLTVTQ